MKEICLIYYGQLDEIKDHFLYLLKFIKFLPSQEGRENGLYLIETRYGQKIEKKVRLNLLDHGQNDNNDDVVLIFRYLSSEEMDKFIKIERNSKIYILLHKMLDLEYLKNNIICHLHSPGYVASAATESLLYDEPEMKKYFQTNNVYQIKFTQEQQEHKTADKTIFQLPIVILFFIKLLINPLNEVRRYYQLVQYMNFRLLSRLLELVLFIGYLNKVILYPIFSFLANMLYYRSRHLLYQLRHFLHYQVGYFLYYRVGYGIRHVIIMTAFKTYGLLYKLLMYTHRVTKLILLYPIFKLYWFLSFQYNKRIKKYFSHDS